MNLPLGGTGCHGLQGKGGLPKTVQEHATRSAATNKLPRFWHIR